MRGVAHGAPPHIIDRLVRNTGVAELESNQRGKVAVGFHRFALDDGAAIGRLLHLARDLFADFECRHANVGTDGHDELARIVGKRHNRQWHDSGNGAAPTRVHRANLTSRWMCDQDGYAIRGARSHASPFHTGDERIAFQVRGCVSRVSLEDLANLGSVDLPLFVEAIAAKPQALCKARAVLANGLVIVAQVEAKVERVVGRKAHPARPHGKRMAEAVPIQKGGMQRTHTVVCSMARLRGPPPRAKQGVPKVRAGSWLVHRFPSKEWTAALRIALNNDRAYREVGKVWTFGAVAMIVRSDPANGVEQAAGVILDVHAGECRSARFVEGTDDPPEAEFVIVASYARWKEVIEGKLDPIKGMMEGKLKLTRGHLPTIIRFVEPSRLVVSSASKVPTDFT